MRTAWVCFPTAPYTHQSAVQAAHRVLGGQGWRIEAPDNLQAFEQQPDVPRNADLYFGDYDLLPFEEVHPVNGQQVRTTSSSSPSAGSSDGVANVLFPQLSSYVIRKSLIRKNYLAHSLHLARVKGKSTNADVRRVGLAERQEDISPRTWAFEATCAEDLDELMADDLYDVRQILEENDGRPSESRTWFILKPAMADQGMGVRLFDTVDALEAIFEEFEEVSDDEGEEIGTSATMNGSKATAVVTSQVRQFVIQEYLSNPLLVRAPTLPNLHKFHLRAYVLAQGNLRVFLYDDMLALFAARSYERPDLEAGPIDLSAHLTNTSRQDEEQSQRSVHLLSDLQGCSFGGTSSADDDHAAIITEEHLDAIRLGAAATIAEAFEASTKAGRIHFQPWPNAWEIFGFDLMVTLPTGQGARPSACKPNDLRVWLLEVNAQPDFAKTGERLQGKIDRLFERALQITVLGQERDVQQTSDAARPSWQPGISHDQMTLCLDMSMSAGGW